MLKHEPKQLSIHSILYNRIPKNHILKRINSAVDFSFVNELLEDSYCIDYGRPARSPEMMTKISFLAYLYELSDEQVLNAVNENLTFMWFIGINPEDDLPHPSLLSKFRTQRLKEKTLDDILKEIVRQCVEKGIIQGTSISVDSTHTEANTTKLVPERIMKRLAQKIMKSLEEEDSEVLEEINQDIPDYKQIEDHQQAKEIMKDYLEDLMGDVQTRINPEEAVKTQEVINTAKEILEDPKFMEQKGVRSLVDKDARVGYKSKTENFFGYKVEYAMTVEDRIITAINVYDGAYVDGTGYESLYNRTKECGINITKAYGDKAYFRQSIIDFLEKEKVEIYIPVSESVYKMDEKRFTYNKDSDQWYCMMGNYTVRKKSIRRKKRGREYNYLRYYFEREKCRNCPNKEECNTGTRIAKMLDISVNTPKFYEYSQREKTEKFKEEYRKRACHEGKNGEMKRLHGMNRARGYGLKSMQIQAKLTAIAVNLKRIANLVSSYSNNKWVIMVINKRYFEKGLIFKVNAA